MKRSPALSQVALVALVALAVPSLAGCQLHGKPHVKRTAALRGEPGQVEAATYAAAPATIPGGSAAPVVIAPGIVEPWGDAIELSAQDPGRISAILVREGDTVSAGQLLATLEDESQRHAVDLARAGLAEAEAELERTERGATPEELTQALAEFEAAAARRDLALADSSRASWLNDSGVGAKSEYDRLRSEAAEQAALARRAAARLEELKRGARAEDRVAAGARAVAARARLALAEASLARRRVVTPSAGTVLLSRFHPGEYYDPNAGTLFVIGDVTRLQVRLEVDEIDALSLRVGAPCTLYSDGEELLARGTVVRLAPKMGRRLLPLESPTARADVRIREAFVEVPASAALVPGQRVWGHTPRATRRNPS